ncbi:accessory gene regulator B [Clostridium sp. DSM 8431]|uniref:accessory gene regulator B family protein n=1 Tax=Clostridium sp. DSM 8431 TaxID=1761781 RepID=UPI0008F29B59|nr:accessory gene regulator B family protein [Clostridium sp. DSM 8431]SFU61934.1 accessory gene regulator B [Clostridium sp. DSM 8431]
MIRKLCDNFVDFICENNYSSDEKSIMAYSLKVLTFELLKFIGCSILFYSLGHFLDSVIVLTSLYLTRPFIGGYHENSQFRCFLTTIIIVSLIIIISNDCTLKFNSLLIIIVSSYFSIYHQAPIINKNMPLTKPKLIMQNRRKGFINLLIISLAAIILYLNKYYYYSYLLTWSILSLTILMFNKFSFKESIH